MKLWILIRVAETPVYDVVNQMLVAAETEDEARALASKVAGDEKPETWLNPERSRCHVMAPVTEGRVLMMEGRDG